MFVRGCENLPRDPSFPANLDKLGFGFNGKGQLVDKETGKFYEFYSSDNDRANDTRKEAMHGGARQAVKDELRNYDVQEIYLTGSEGRDIEDEKPEPKHVTILSSDPKALKKKSDVIIIVPERNQDLGIWTYRELMREGGIDRGSVVGLVKKLQDITLCGDIKTTQKPGDQSDPLDGAMTEFRKKEKTSIPGIIVLNPGQLVYSSSLNTCMSEESWLARPKENALEDNIEIDPRWNRVPGHKDPREHVGTVLEHVVPKLVAPKTRIWLVGVTDGAETLIKYTDGRCSNARKVIVPGRTVEAMAFINSTHYPDEIKSDLTKLKLKMRGKGWMLSDQPFGTVLTVPEPAPARPRDYEDEITSDPIPIPTPGGVKINPRRQSEANALTDLLRPIADPGKNQDIPVGKPRQRAFTALDIPRHIGSFGSRDKVPLLNPFLALPPDDGSSFASLEDDKMPDAEAEAKERLIQKAMATSPTSPSYLNPHATMSGVEVRDFGAVAEDVNYDSSEKATSATVKTPESPSSFDERPKMPLNSRQLQNLLAKYDKPGSDKAGDRGKEDDGAAVYSGSEYSGDEEDDPAKKAKGNCDEEDLEDSGLLVGGDYDDDGGLWMKDARRTPTPELSESGSSPVSEPEAGVAVGGGQGHGVEGSSDDESDHDTGAGDRVETASLSGSDVSSDYEDAPEALTDVPIFDPEDEWSDGELSISEPDEDGDGDEVVLMEQEVEVGDVEDGAETFTPITGEMLTVSGGVSDVVELILPVALDDILAWFVEMSYKT